MYFVVIMAFAFVLSDNLPPEALNLFPGSGLAGGIPLTGTLLVVAGQLLLVAFAALYCSRRTCAKLDGTEKGHDRATQAFSRSQRVLLIILGAMLVITMVLTPWTRLVREAWGLDAIPLLGDLALLMPFFLSVLIIWMVLYVAEHRIRTEAFSPVQRLPAPPAAPRQNEATAALTAAQRTSAEAEDGMGTYLLDKIRHQVLIIAAPMSLIVLAKHFTDLFKADLTRLTSAPWAADAILGVVSVCVLAFAPVILRYTWSTEPLPAGPLRDRFVRMCERIGLRYSEILLWHTHGMTINAAVMGFVAPLRYILVSDALLETMDEEEIEAVFGHEAGHVQHWHLQFFALFALVSMYLAGGTLHLLINLGVYDPGLLQLAALAVLMFLWLFGFGWLSRRFERQADLFSVRCIAPDITACVDRCPVHGVKRASGICVSAGSLFGRTLAKIADLNGIPRTAPSWRHGSIEARRRLIERFAGDSAEIDRFDRLVLRLKTGLVIAALVGTAAAGWLYFDDLLRIVRTWQHAG